MELNRERPKEPAFIVRSTCYVVGADLGQSSDPTAVCVIEHLKGVLDPNSEFERHTGCSMLPQKKTERLAVRHLERLPLRTSYVDVVEHIKRLLVRPPLDDPQTVLVIDETGVGRAVGDIFVGAGMKPKRVSITAGSEEASINGFDRWHVAKSILITRLDASLHTGLLSFAGELFNSPLGEELRNFRRDVSAAGRATYQARTGHHDDTVLAVSLANWWATRPPPAFPVFSNYGHPGDEPPPRPPIFTPSASRATRGDRWE